MAVSDLLYAKAFTCPPPPFLLAYDPIKPNSIYHCRPHSPTKTFPKIDKYSCGQINKRKGELKDKILNTYQLPLQTNPTAAVNNNSKEEEDGGTDIYGYCDHNIEKEKKIYISEVFETLTIFK